MTPFFESMVDIGQYVLAHHGKRADGQRDVFRLLAHSGIVDSALADRLQHALGFHNILIHAYPHLDDEKVATYLTDNLDDFDAFLAIVNQLMEQNESATEKNTFE